jgi:hypothetical protein
MRKRMAKWVIWYMATVMFLLGVTPRVDAAFSPSEALAFFQSDRQSDIQKIQNVLEVKMVRERLKAFGFSQDEIQARLNQMNDQQIHQMAQKLDDLNVGGDGGEVIVALLVIAILVLIIYYLLGHQVVIK